LAKVEKKGGTPTVLLEKPLLQMARKSDTSEAKTEGGKGDQGGNERKSPQYEVAPSKNEKRPSSATKKKGGNRFNKKRTDG